MRPHLAEPFYYFQKGMKHFYLPESLVPAAQSKFQLSICDIGKMTFCLTMAKYLPMLPKGKTTSQLNETEQK
jgi:hypothetical protein